MATDAPDGVGFLSPKTPAAITDEVIQLVHIRQEELNATTGGLILNQTAEEEAVALPPVDRGSHAWIFVSCSFIVECLVWGFPYRYVRSILNVPNSSRSISPRK